MEKPHKLIITKGLEIESLLLGVFIETKPWIEVTNYPHNWQEALLLIEEMDCRKSKI